MSNYKKFFYIFASVLSLIIFLGIYANYRQTQILKEKILQLQAKNLILFISSFREVYQKNFLKYHITLNDKTIHLVPVVAMPDIVRLLSKGMHEGIEIKLISDNPRNIKNMANKEDMAFLKQFMQTKQKEPIIIDNNNTFVYYKPLYIKKSCLVCHASKKDAPGYIKSNYKNSYGYKLGDLRGAIVIKINNSDFVQLLNTHLFMRIILAISLYIILLTLVYLLLKKFEEKDKKYIQDLTIANQKLEVEKQKAQHAAKVKSEFLANMSHEIRTPLNAMFGFIKLLEDEKLDKEAKKYLEIIEKSGENLLTIINDILDFSKIESGKLSIEKVSFNPKNEFSIIRNLFEARANEKYIKLYVEENLKDNIITDPVRVKQVISNLLSNAIKFTPENKNIYFKCFYDNKKEELYIEVKDEGIGISKDKIDLIFQPFTQADNSTTRKYGGTGLGLTISYNLVKLLGGELKVESEENKGSKFYFTIPAKKSDKSLNKKVEVKIEEKFNYHILVAEDNKANQMFMSVILKKLGLSFDMANDGIEVVEKYKLNYEKYDLVLMDENMPNMTGSEATIEIRKFEKENNLKRTFIIALTANALSGDKEKFLEAGMDEYLSKPLNIEKLKEILRKLK